MLPHSLNARNTVRTRRDDDAGATDYLDHTTMQTSIAQKPDAEALAEVMEMLDRWDDRMAGHQTQRRKYKRLRFRARITVKLPELADFDHVLEEESSFLVWARNLSKAGVGFLHHGWIDSRKVIICLDPDGGDDHSHLAKIVRSRKMPEGFWEYGAVFIGSATKGEAAAEE